MKDIAREAQGEEQAISLDAGVEEVGSGKPFIEPKLTFIKPKLVKRGRLEQVTGFFGTFSP